MVQSAKFVVLLLALCLCVSAVSVSAASNSDNAFVLTGDDRAYLDSIRGEPIVLGTVSEMMSFTNIDGTPSGMLMPVIDLLENEFGLTVRTGVVEWGEAFKQLDDGTIDMFGLAISSEARRAKYLATETLFVSGLDIYSRVNDPIGNLMNLGGKSIACVENSVLPQIMLKYVKPSTIIKYYSKTEDMFTALESGEVDCIFAAMSIQSELMNHPDVRYETRVTSVRTPQCLYSGNQKLARLFDIINRYIRSDSGGRLISDIKEGRGDAILQAARMHFARDIDDLRANYKPLRVYDSGTLYPLCYFENGEYKGLQRDINDVFYRLTGIPIEICPPSDFENGLITALDEIQRGELVGATGTYLNSGLARNSNFVFSEPVMNDQLRIYTSVNNKKPLQELRIGTTTFAATYVDWPTLVTQKPLIYSSRDLLVSALKRGEIDAIFFGEMSVDYYYTIQKDYSLERIGDISVDTAYYILMDSDNQSFNNLYNEAIKLEEMINPDGGEKWIGASNEDKFAFMRLQSRISSYQETAIIVCVALFIVFCVLLYGLRYQNKKFRTYDRQITLMLTAQKNADMIWGNVATGKLVSKGNFPIYRNWDLGNHPYMALSDAIVSEGFFNDIKNDLKEINETGSEYNVAEKMFFSHANGSKYYIRRYTHMINENEFMVFTLDTTDEKQREAALSELANTDPLSKLRNRRSMQEMLCYMASKFASSATRLFIVMLDVDNFKTVNDNYGHQIGDDVLVGIAKTFHETAPDCVAARWGGEEFLIALELKTIEEAIETVERIREEISHKVFPVGTRTSFSVTVSCGISELLPAADVLDTVSLADSAMYTAKMSGKNCVKIKLE